MPAALSVNLNAVAMLRNRRDLPWPSVTGLGRTAMAAGAHGLTVHPRPDQRHIRFSDLPNIRSLLDKEFPHGEFNIEGYPTEEFLSLCEAHRPDQVTLVPDDPSQPTSDHGWDFIAQKEILKSVTKRLKDNGFRVSHFCDPDADERQLDAAAATGADRVELYTGPYGATFNDNSAQSDKADQLGRTADLAEERGLGVNAGHDLTVANLPPLVAAIPNLSEVSIGHGLTADALEYGMAGTVERFLAALKGGCTDGR
ncbi:pyridoxine 5'-phosphate synthase [Notoacmeibacter sp. MSK16QG-6]|uniref:pyridoxine 5'-phosphate synthase n=1 Tax=Notoacmeibacter sp. MSK16QG-6 TaxID=2957982 RepID=UPI0020A18D05|nr:pyridoxine 5'-phosphate synthase [Notoacmeibacter sp. MSK16QG-6]MCP1199637.1 pyridoxine 5'-phosphate synthase [Notoacmeibacter sp. MSK16QG-6]